MNTATAAHTDRGPKKQNRRTPVEATEKPTDDWIWAQLNDPRNNAAIEKAFGVAMSRNVNYLLGNKKHVAGQLQATLLALGADSSERMLSTFVAHAAWAGIDVDSAILDRLVARREGKIEVEPGVFADPPVMTELELVRALQGDAPPAREPSPKPPAGKQRNPNGKRARKAAAAEAAARAQGKAPKGFGKDPVPAFVEA